MNKENDRTLRRVAAALTSVLLPSGEDILSSGRVRDLEVSDDGVVRFRFALGKDDPGSTVRDARAAAEKVEGVTRVKIDVGLPAAAGAGEGAAQGKSPLRPGSVPAPTPQPGVLPGVRHVVAVSSGKGGVGKSTVATNLAVALAQELRVGLLDADVYGPNIPTMFGEKRRPGIGGDKGKETIIPLETHGVRLMSLGFLLEPGQPAVMRGPLISGILRQFVEQVEWGELDVLVVDMPPGTGDAQLSLVQTVPVDGVVMVTTPQQVATGDVLRAIRMFEKVETRVFGVIENMAGFACPCCGETTDIFGRGGAAALCEEAGVPLLGGVPIDVAIREGADRGEPIITAAPESPAAQAFRALADEITRTLGVATEPIAAG